MKLLKIPSVAAHVDDICVLAKVLHAAQVL